MALRILLLGGTQEARLLAEQLLGKPDVDITFSLSGALGDNAEAAFRSRMPHLVGPKTKIRVGGFGGVKGLAQYISENSVDLIIDATHPFAQSMSQNAVSASALCNCPIVRFERQPWNAQTCDRWIHVEGLEAAAHCLPQGARAFLSVGKQSVSSFANRSNCWFLVRSIAPIDTTCFSSPVHCLNSLPETNVAAEVALMKQFDIDCLVTKNSGAIQAYGKIAAARQMGIKVIVIDRPSLAPCPVFHVLEELELWLDDKLQRL